MFSLFQAPQNFPHVPNRVSHVYYRNSVISILQSNHAIVMAVAQNLSAYMEKARKYNKGTVDYRSYIDLGHWSRGLFDTDFGGLLGALTHKSGVDLQ